MLKTQNLLERVMREIHRHTRVIGAFPDGNSAQMLVAARLRHIASSHWADRRYFDDIASPNKTENRKRRDLRKPRQPQRIHKPHKLYQSKN